MELALKALEKYFTLLSIILLVSACAYKPGEPLALMDGSQTGVIFFTSTDDYDFNRGEPPIPLIVDGFLNIPENHNGSALILSHGSGRRSEGQAQWAKIFRSQGIATFSLNHFGPRNVLSTAHSQVRVTEQQMASDIIHAGKLLASNQQIDKDKIFHIGWSKGATAGLAAAIESSYSTSTKNDQSISGYIAFYPFCGFTGDVKPSAKVLLLHGREDSWTPLAPCERLVSEMQAVGGNVTLQVFDGAQHGFDNWNLETRRIRPAITIRDTSDKCTLVFSKQSHTISADGNHSIADFQSRLNFLKACGVRGVNIGGSQKYRKTVEGMVLGFIKGY